jgi:hypothetical protein
MEFNSVFKGLKKRTEDDDEFSASRDGELNTATMVNGVLN